MTNGAGFAVPIYQAIYQGLVAASGSINVYQTGTTTPVTCYSDYGLTTPITNPITLDANGEAVFYTSGAVLLRIDSFTSSGALIKSIDPVLNVGGPQTLPGNNTITNAMLAQANGFTLKGNNTGSTANVADLSVAQVRAMILIAPLGQISGLLPTAQSFVSNTSATLSFTSGQATDSTGAITLSGIQANLAWNVANGNATGGYQGGTTLPNSSTIHFYATASSTDTTWHTTFASTSLTPTLPSGQLYYRRVFSLNTNASGVLLAGNAIEVDGGSMLYYLATTRLDATTTTQGTTQVLYPLTVPSGIKVQPIIRANQTGGGFTLITSPDENNEAPASNPTTVPGFDITSTATSYEGPITTNTSAQIAVRATTTLTTFGIVTRGFRDFRRN